MSSLYTKAPATSTTYGTVLGLKSYVVGQSYTNGTIALTNSANMVSPVAPSNGNGFIPYQTVDGQWRLKFNLAVTFTNVNINAGGLFLLHISGISFATNGSTTEFTGGALSASCTSSNSIFTTNSGTFYNNSDDIGAFLMPFTGTQSVSQIIFSGDVLLASKPTWAD